MLFKLTSYNVKKEQEKNSSLLRTGSFYSKNSIEELDKNLLVYNTRQILEEVLANHGYNLKKYRERLYNLEKSGKSNLCLLELERRINVINNFIKEKNVLNFSGGHLEAVEDLEKLFNSYTEVFSELSCRVYSEVHFPNKYNFIIQVNKQLKEKFYSNLRDFFNKKIKKLKEAKNNKKIVDQIVLSINGIIKNINDRLIAFAEQKGRANLSPPEQDLLNYYTDIVQNFDILNYLSQNTNGLNR